MRHIILARDLEKFDQLREEIAQHGCKVVSEHRQPLRGHGFLVVLNADPDYLAALKQMDGVSVTEEVQGQMEQ